MAAHSAAIQYFVCSRAGLSRHLRQLKQYPGQYPRCQVRPEHMPAHMPHTHRFNVYTRSRSGQRQRAHSIQHNCCTTLHYRDVDHPPPGSMAASTVSIRAMLLLLRPDPHLNSPFAIRHSPSSIRPSSLRAAQLPL